MATKREKIEQAKRAWTAKQTPDFCALSAEVDALGAVIRDLEDALQCAMEAEGQARQAVRAAHLALSALRLQLEPRRFRLDAMRSVEGHSAPQ